MKKNSGKAPSIQFYYKDWLADERLKMCSLRAKGLWIEIICQSVSMPIPGVFAFKNESKRDQNGDKFEAISEEKLLQMFNGKTSEKRRAFAELKTYGVIKQTESKCFYVKRIKEDMRLREIRKAAGKKGGNPALVGRKVKNLDNQNSNQKGKQNLTPSTSNSNSYLNNISTNSNFSKELVLEIQKEGLRLSTSLEQRLGPFLPQEQKTFASIGSFLCQLAKKQRTAEPIARALSLLHDKIDYCQRREKSLSEAKPLFVAAIKKEFGYKGR